jgi:hypothetical protein
LEGLAEFQTSDLRVSMRPLWLRVSTGHQETENPVPDVERFAAHHGYEFAARYEVGLAS